MWYFTWMLGIGFAVMLAILNALWGEYEQERQSGSLSSGTTGKGDTPHA